MNYSKKSLLESYIISEIYNIEKKDLLEEGKIFNWFKSKFSDIAGSTDIMKKCKLYLEKTKYKKDKKTLRHRDNIQMSLDLEQNKRFRFKIFALSAIMTAIIIGSGIENPTNKDFQKALPNAEEILKNKTSRDHYNNKDNIIIDTAKEIDSMSGKEKELVLKIFGLTDADFKEKEKSSQPQQSSKDYLYGSKDYFYDWLEKTPQISHINKMTPEQYDAFVNQFTKFLEEEAFKMNKSEVNNAQSLLYLLKNSDHATSESDEGVLSSKRAIRTSNSDLEAIQSFKSSMDHFGDMYGLEADQEGWTPEMAKGVRLIMQKQANDKLENLSYLQSLALERGESGEKYDDLIDKFEEVFFDTFGYEIEDVEYEN